MSRIAFYAPLKSPLHPTPSGDREIARGLMQALEMAGHEPFIVSELRLREADGDDARQRRLHARATADAMRLAAEMRDDPPALWFTYHSYYKAPDILGSNASRLLGIPYVVAEPSHAPNRGQGRWARFSAANRAALERADRLIWSKPRDLPGLERIAQPGQLARLPPFLDPGPEPSAPPPADHLRLLTVAMMREGDKEASFTALAAALSHLTRPWTLTVIGDGPRRDRVETLFSPFSRVHFAGQIDDRIRLRGCYETHDLLVWPGIGEGIGMVYLEAQAAGLPALAEDHPGPAAVLGTDRLPAPGDAPGFARAIAHLADNPLARNRARTHILAHHGLDAAAHRLSEIVEPLLS